MATANVAQGIVHSGNVVSNVIVNFQYRNRARGVNCAKPLNDDQPRPVPRIASSHGSPKIENETLALLARQLSKLDAMVLDLTIEAFKLMAEQNVDLWGFVQKVDYQQEIITAQSARREIVDIQGGRLSFGQQYLSDEGMILFWNRAITVLQVLYRTGTEGNEGNLTTSLHNSKPLFTAAARLPSLLVAAEKGRLLKKEVADAVRERVLKMEDLWEAMKEPLTDQGFSFTPWYDIRDRMDAARQPGSNGGATGLNPSLTVTSTLWILFLTTTLGATPLSYFAYGYADHTRGSVWDSDFWFLLQGCLTQWFGLWAAWTSMTNTQARSAWRGALLVLTALIAAAAPVVFVLGPSPWGDFLAWAGSAFQAYFSLQVAIDTASRRWV